MVSQLPKRPTVGISQQQVERLFELAPGWFASRQKPAPAQLARALESLTPQSLWVIALLLGATGQPPMTQLECADYLDRSLKTIRNTQSSAYKRLAIALASPVADSD